MSTHNIPFQYKIENHPKLPKICSYGFFSTGFKSDFETAVVNEPSVFEPQKIYFILIERHYVFCLFLNSADHLDMNEKLLKVKWSKYTSQKSDLVKSFKH